MAFNRFIFSIIILLITSVLVWFFVFPIYKEFKNLQSEIFLKEAEYNAKNAYYAEVLNISNELDKRQDILNKIDNALPDNLFLAPLVYYLQKKTSESGLIMKDLFFAKASSVATNNQVKEIVFSTNVIGSYSALKNFLMVLEKSANLFEINNISFSSSSKSMQGYPFLLEIKTHSY
jgi:Tfp pilus assembly protein PilO